MIEEDRYGAVCPECDTPLVSLFELDEDLNLCCLNVVELYCPKCGFSEEIFDDPVLFKADLKFLKILNDK